jgi:hypothetical protein
VARLLICFGKVAYKPQATLFQAVHEFAEALQGAVNPETAVSRYGRIWRVSQPVHRDRFFLGKLGFMSSGTETIPYYDEKRKDFIEQAVSAKRGHYVQWAIDLSTQIIAFETKPPDIKYQSFIGAFVGLLNERADIGLTMERIVESDRFFEWAKQIDRLTRFTAKLRTPNPNFARRPRIVRELLEDTNGDSAKVEISKSKESSEALKTEKTIRDLVKYGEEGYSTVIAHGFKDGSPKVFDSKRKIPLERIEISLPISVEKIWDQIIRALTKFRK